MTLSFRSLSCFRFSGYFHHQFQLRLTIPSLRLPSPFASCSGACERPLPFGALFSGIEIVLFSVKNLSADAGLRALSVLGHS